MSYIYIGISTIIALVLHEMAHAYTSYWLGDPTPKHEGRLSPNPLKHLDPIGAICLFLFHFGWAKPVAINSRYYKNYKVGTCLVSLAGPAMNFILAAIGTIALNFVYYGAFGQFLQYFIMINVGLMTFNLIPLPPLDGSKILATFLPDNVYDQFMSIQRYSMLILMIILSTGVLNPLLTAMRNLVMSLLSVLLF